MKKMLALALVAATLVTPAFAADVCNVAAAKAQPKDALKAQLEKDGWAVKQIKENLFDPETLKMLDVEAD